MSPPISPRYSEPGKSASRKARKFTAAADALRRAAPADRGFDELSGPERQRLRDRFRAVCAAGDAVGAGVAHICALVTGGTDSELWGPLIETCCAADEWQQPGEPAEQVAAEAAAPGESIVGGEGERRWRTRSGLASGPPPPAPKSGEAPGGTGASNQNLVRGKSAPRKINSPAEKSNRFFESAELRSFCRRSQPLTKPIKSAGRPPGASSAAHSGGNKCRS
jgi:hypothetical protein